MDWNDYYTTLDKKKYPLENAFEHGQFLLNSERNDEDENKKFSAVIDKDLQLTNIGDDSLMSLYQNDAVLLTQLLDMSKRDKRLIRVFNVLYYSWRSQLLITKAHRGGERKHQAQIGTSYMPRESLGGYGESYTQPSEEEQGNGNIFNKLFKKG